MRANVAETAARATLRRIGPPCGLLLATLLKPRAQPTLQIETPYRLNLAQLATQNHLARLSHQRIARVGMRHGKDHSGLINRLGQFLRLRKIESHRFIADHIEARLNRLHCYVKMRVIGRGDADKIDPLCVGQFLFTRHKFFKGSVCSLGRECRNRRQMP